VHLGDPDPRFLRFPKSLTMIDFAEEVYQRAAAFDHLTPNLRESIWEAVEANSWNR